MKRPRLKIKLDKFDWIIEIVGLIFVLLLLAFPLYYYSDMPDVIPTNFDSSGEYSQLGDKNKIWLLPIVGIVFYVGLFLLNKIPHRFNYLVEITENNALRQYRIGTKLIRILRMLIAVAFFYIANGIIKVSIGESTGLGAYFLPIFLIILFGVIGVALYQSLKKQ